MQPAVTGSGVRSLPQANDVIERLLVDDETFGTTMLAIVVDRFGPQRETDEALDCLTWSPATLRAELERVFKVEPSAGNIDRLMTAIDIVTSDAFWNDISAFIRGCNAFSGSEANFTDFDPADVMECAWGVAEATLLWPDHEEDPAFPSEIVRAYVVNQLKMEGFSRPPSILTEFVLPGDLIESVQDMGDPDITLGMAKSNDAKASEVDDHLRQEIDRLLSQLESLPMKTGNTQKLAASLKRGIGHAPVSSR